MEAAFQLGMYFFRKAREYVEEADIRIIADIFGPHYTSMLFGITLLSHNIGSFLGSWLGGRIFDYAGSYDYMWLICIAIGFLSTAFHLPIKGDALKRYNKAESYLI